mmetsp:Transcript_76642/g.173360  ORF Transcript_76642/g.173360 Transcript_76642/m.173360 type:complete len:453 (-) Transcript_76642:690-2048(-)
MVPSFDHGLVPLQQLPDLAVDEHAEDGEYTEYLQPSPLVPEPHEGGNYGDELARGHDPAEDEPAKLLECVVYEDLPDGSCEGKDRELEDGIQVQGGRVQAAMKPGTQEDEPIKQRREEASSKHHLPVAHLREALRHSRLVLGAEGVKRKEEHQEEEPHLQPPGDQALEQASLGSSTGPVRARLPARRVVLELHGHDREDKDEGLHPLRAGVPGAVEHSAHQHGRQQRRALPQHLQDEGDVLEHLVSGPRGKLIGSGECGKVSEVRAKRVLAHQNEHAVVQRDGHGSHDDSRQPAGHHHVYCRHARHRHQVLLQDTIDQVDHIDAHGHKDNLHGFTQCAVHRHPAYDVAHRSPDDHEDVRREDRQHHFREHVNPLEHRNDKADKQQHGQPQSGQSPSQLLHHCLDHHLCLTLFGAQGVPVVRLAQEVGYIMHRRKRLLRDRQAQERAERVPPL